MILNQLKHNSYSLGTSVSIHVVSTVKASDEISKKTVSFNLLELIQRGKKQRNQIAPCPSNLTGLMSKADLIICLMKQYKNHLSDIALSFRSIDPSANLSAD